MAPSPGPEGARELVQRHEASIDPSRRRELGAHYTPRALAERIVRLGTDQLGRVPARVCDPSCGAGSVLLAVADRLVEFGVAPEEVLRDRLVGLDIDPAAVAAARTALTRWAEDHRLAHPPGPSVFVGDALAAPGSVAGAAVAPMDLVVGNPPFLSPLSADVVRSSPGTSPADRRAQSDRVARDSSPSDSLGAYTDASAAHLLAATRMVVPGGVVCLLQPQSLLGSRDAGTVRAALARIARLAALWVTDDHPFSVDVGVCAPVLVREVPRTLEPAKVAVHWRDEPAVSVRLQAPRAQTAEGDPGADPPGGPRGLRSVAAPWSPLLAAVLGVPIPESDPSKDLGRVADLARCTAGFRDEFYALADVVRELDARPSASCSHPPVRLVTSGMIDPGVLRWGEATRRIGGRSVLAPVADMDDLARRSPRVARWVAARQVPKVLVATQTKVIEAVCDSEGDCVPVTPVISIEPFGATPDPRPAAGVLAAPSSSARLAAEAAGTGRNTSAFRVRAATLAELPAGTSAAALSGSAAAWAQLAGLAAGGVHQERAWRRAGAALDAALGVHDPAVLEWWLARLPARLLDRAVRI